jgi:dCMP deaminase
VSTDLLEDDIIREWKFVDKWDVRFLEMASMVSTWSKDPSTKTGAVIVRPDRSVCSVGFNGFARQMSDHEDNYNDRPRKYSRIIHCEMNALLAAKESVSGYTLYTTGMCCDRCVVHQIQAGISRFVYWADTDDMKSRWAEAFALTKSYMDEAGVDYVEVDL